MKPGEQFVAHVGFDRLNQAASMNQAQGEHLWVLITTYGLTDEEAAHAGEGVQVMLDDAHLLAVSSVGCFTCEQLYEDSVGTKCPGEPS